MAFGKKPQCPLCGKEVDTFLVGWVADWTDENGKTWRFNFCGGPHKSEFDKDPEKYVKEARAKGYLLAEEWE